MDKDPSSRLYRGDLNLEGFDSLRHEAERSLETIAEAKKLAAELKPQGTGLTSGALLAHPVTQNAQCEDLRPCGADTIPMSL